MYELWVVLRITEGHPNLKGEPKEERIVLYESGTDAICKYQEIVDAATRICNS